MGQRNIRFELSPDKLLLNVTKMVCRRVWNLFPLDCLPLEVLGLSPIPPAISRVMQNKFLYILKFQFPRMEKYHTHISGLL